MQLNIAICDNNPNDIKILQQYLENYEIKSDIEFNILTFTDSSRLLSGYSQSEIFHLLFLEAELPQKSGIEVASFIRNTLHDFNVKIIFLSSSLKYIQQSFDVGAYHYYLKPFQKSDFLALMHRFTMTLKTSRSHIVLMEEDNTRELVYLNDILYIATKDSSIKRLSIVLTGKTVTAIGRISEYEKELCHLGFVSPAKGYLVNLRYVQYIQNSALILHDGTEIHLSRRRFKGIRNLFDKWTLKLVDE